MKRELFIHFAFWFAFFVFISVFKSYLSLGYWPFWVGGAVGLFLPDIDHLVYVLFTKPQELTSQRFLFLLGKRETWRAVELLYETRSERRGLVFHTILFQMIFLVLTFWIMSSSGSLFGKGLVLSFALHLSVDQMTDLTEAGDFSNWLQMAPFNLDLDKSKIYWAVTFILVLVLGFFI